MFFNRKKGNIANLETSEPEFIYTASIQRGSPAPETENRLDGLTILRFYMGYKEGGGMEQCIIDMNKAILQRNSMTVIQLFLADNNNDLDETREKVGYGTLINIPFIAQRFDSGQFARNWIKEILAKLRIKSIFRDWIIYNPVLSLYIKRFFVKKNYSRWHIEAINIGEKVREIFNRYHVDLVVIHSAGGLSSAKIIHEAHRKNIPYVFLNHFENSRMKDIGVREQARGAAGVGGSSSQNIPKYIKSRYINLSDGINTEFYRRDHARPVSHEFDIPVVILPARIVPGKGHRDLICAAHRLKRDGVSFKVIFTGKPKQPEFKMNLERLIEKYGISDDVLFVGYLTFDELRDWYAASKVVVLPSNSEGLPRVLLEAQAMKTPVIAYDVGGISEALINGETGYIVRKGSIRGLSARIKELLKDDDKRVQMGEAGRKFVEKQFSFPALAMRHEDWYLRAIYKGVSASNHP